jgi:hypothetical protein
MLDALTYLAPAIEADTATSEAEPSPGRKVLFLNGEWWLRRDHFCFEGRIELSPGSASGQLWWKVITSTSTRAGLTWTEKVSGSLCGSGLDLDCLELSNRLLVRERYRFVLAGGDEIGVFQGQADAYKGAWDARMSGQWRIVTEHA